MYRIGTFSQLGKTTVKTLRHYDEIGLLRPEYTDDFTGYRYYSTDQLFRLHRILSLRQMGFSLVEIASILDGRRTDEIFRRREEEIRRQVQTASDQLSRIRHYLQTQKEDLFMSYQAVIKEIPSCIVFSKRTRVADYGALCQTVPAIGAAVTKANPGLECAVPEYCFNIYHDGEYREKDFDVEICEAVTAFGKETDGIIFKEMPGVTVVCAMHKGPYTDLGGAYAFLSKWIEDNGYTMAGNPRESFIDGIWNKESEAGWLTEVQMPIEKK